MKYLSAIILYIFCCKDVLSNNDHAFSIYTESFPPYNYLENDKIVGINTEIVSMMCANTNLHCNIKLLPWNRAVALSKKTPNSAIYSMSRNLNREKQYKWVGPLVASNNYFFRLKSRTDINISEVSQATNYSIAAPRNDIYEKVLKERGFKNILSLSSKYQDVKLFLTGKIDLLVASPLTLPHQLAKHGVSIDMVTKLIPLNVPELQGNYLALHPNTSENVIRKLQNSLNLLRNSGKILELTEQYKTKHIAN